jgi:hypothetical protein
MKLRTISAFVSFSPLSAPPTQKGSASAPLGLERREETSLDQGGAVGGCFVKKKAGFYLALPFLTLGKRQNTSGSSFVLLALSG